MIVVSDTSLITNLAAVGQLNLLQQLYSSIIIPQAVLIEAKQKGLIPTVKPILNDLMAQVGFRVSNKLYADTLQAAGE